MRNMDEHSIQLLQGPARPLGSSPALGLSNPTTTPYVWGSVAAYAARWALDVPILGR